MKGDYAEDTVFYLYSAKCIKSNSHYNLNYEGSSLDLNIEKVKILLNNKIAQMRGQQKTKWSW